MANAEQLEGGCACGEVRYRLRWPPMFVHCCHCTDCQRQSGSAFVVNALIEAARVELLSGRLAQFRTRTESGFDHTLEHCPTCGVAVWSIYGGRERMRAVKTGALDDPSPVRPDVHIFVRSKRPWVALDPSIPAFETIYDREKTWPAEALARRAAALAPGP